MKKIAIVAFLALAVATALSAASLPKGIVLWPHQAQKRSDLSAAISLEYSYALPCDIVSGTNAAGALVCDWSRLDSLLDDIASRGHQAIVRFRYAYPHAKLGDLRIFFLNGSRHGELFVRFKRLRAFPELNDLLFPPRRFLLVPAGFLRHGRPLPGFHFKAYRFDAFGDFRVEQLGMHLRGDRRVTRLVHLENLSAIRAFNLVHSHSPVVHGSC